MSGEFGSYVGGYLHDQMDVASDDLAQGRFESTRVWADLVAEFAKVSKAISWAEAGDTNEAHSILKSIERLPAIKSCLADVEAFFAPYQEVAQKAIQSQTEKECG